MKQSNWKFFVIIGVLLIGVGAIIFPDDEIIGAIGVLLGVYNIYKGIRLARGVQPYLIRKQQERQKEIRKELEDKFKDSNNQK